ncbi:uncharacterized protein LOC143008807 isoform X2 [Genypterus blacodes]|uniref:uncharacterized protein LOC143008807 isoform X2 n=1 Tax=Genypterus blacodes TaxID=154954 RepID=UPI003F770595
MSGFVCFQLSLLILGSSCAAWQVNLPSNIKGLKGSCLVIPCSFDYYENPPRDPTRVVWYQYKNRGYPLVYDPLYPNHVIEEFNGKTKLIRKLSKSCTLEIYPLDWSHHRQKLYPWVDPEHVGKGIYRFFDTTVTIEVVDRVKKPVIYFLGNLKVGQEVTVQCVVYHTCSSFPPTLELNNTMQKRKITHNSFSDGMSKTTLTAIYYIDKDHQAVVCSVRHHGGLRDKTLKTLNAECSFSALTIQPQSEEFPEGHSKQVTCTATYTCPKDTPTLTWSYNRMPVTADHKKTGGQWKSVSTLTFTASAEDHGKSLTCYARYTGEGRQETSITLQVKRAMASRDWSFTTPGSITGMKGSCVTIPCKFTYSTSQPPGLRVIWYLYQSHGYPPVFDERQNVQDSYKGRTSVIGSVGGRSCTLKIDRLEMIDDHRRFYPWVDKNSVTSYHTLDQTLYDKTTQLLVSDHAQQPELSMIGIPRVGERGSVSCRVRHTCESAPPTLTLNGIRGEDITTNARVADGTWERTVERSWTVKEEDWSVMCMVSYPGGQKATKELHLNVECPHEDIKFDQAPKELTEGVAKNAICSVSYKCKKSKPIISWNYEDLQSTFHIKVVSMDTYNAVSNLTFIGALGDDGKSLTCSAQFIDGQTSASAVLHVKKYEEPIAEPTEAPIQGPTEAPIQGPTEVPIEKPIENSFKELDPHETETLHVLAADVPFRFSGLTRSCVVIPCSFQMEDHKALTNLRGIWSKKSGGVVYHNGQSKVLDHFKGRTRILGDLKQQNCSLEIDDIKPFDNGPFCFKAEEGADRYSFNNSCVFIVMRASPEMPVMSPLTEEVDAGSVIKVTCSVTHTCPSHPPVFSWSVPTLTSEDVHNWTAAEGTWETSSTVTFAAAGGDGVQNLTCTALYWRGKNRTKIVKFRVKGSLMFQLRNARPAGITAGLLIPVILLAVVFGVVIIRKRRHSDNSITPPPRPEKRKSLWDRLSRQRPEDRQEKAGPGTRAKNGRAGWQMNSRSDTKTVNCDIPLSKQRFPSPKANRRAAPPPPTDSTGDCSIYSNF